MPWLHSSSADHPVGSARGDTQRTPSEPCTDAATDHDDEYTDVDHFETPNVQRSDSACARREPAIVTTVPPSVGPSHGVTSCTETDTSSKRTPLDE